MNALTLSNTTIRQLDGLYSLNDLHKASGGEKKHQPSDFIRTDQTQALIAELNSADSRSFQTITGRKGGTYVCRELVFAYAIWISAKFSLMVIRAFDAMHGADTAPVPSGLITPAQAQHLKELVQIINETGKQHYAETWSRFQRKFHVNSYLNLPAVQFEAAVEYLRGKVDEPGIAVIAQKHFPQVAALPAPADDLTAAMEAKLRGTRFIANIDRNGSLVLTSIGHNEIIATPDQFVQYIGDPGAGIPRAMLPKIITTAATRLETLQ